MTRPLILLTNDDGIWADGIAALYAALSRFAEVKVVAPSSERSGVSHSVTLIEPLRVHAVEVNGFRGHRVSGMPADCVKLAVRQLLDRPPDLVASGVNRGNNAGALVHYSGTVGAAREAALMGLPSVAVSLNQWEDPDYTTAAKIGAAICERVTDGALTVPPRAVINVNVPGIPEAEIKGVRLTRHADHAGIEEDYDGRHDPRGGRYFWLVGKFALRETDPDTDVGALNAGYVSVTPLQASLTHDEHLETLRAAGDGLLDGVLDGPGDGAPASEDA